MASDRHPSELRRDFSSGRWVLIAPDRARRPNDYRPAADASAEESRDSCPFCEGHETETPPEVEAIRESASAPNTPGWKVRVFPNKYPALSPNAEEVSGSRTGGVFEFMAGVGVHEVVVDTPDHVSEWADLPVEDLRDILGVFCRRLLSLESEAEARYIQIFKNKGQNAGASLRHSHTQILAVPIIPQQVSDELSVLERVHRSTGRCHFCRLIEEEETGPRIIRSDPDFVALAPFASRFPYEIHVLPRRHSAFFDETSGEELLGLARVMKSVLVRLRNCASDPDYHLVLRQAPSTQAARAIDPHPAASAHWRFEILPVMSRVAGFEWGTGCFINPVVPESAAAVLRNGGTRDENFG